MVLPDRPIDITDRPLISQDVAHRCLRCSVSTEREGPVATYKSRAMNEIPPNFRENCLCRSIRRRQRDALFHLLCCQFGTGSEIQLRVKVFTPERITESAKVQIARSRRR